MEIFFCRTKMSSIWEIYFLRFYFFWGFFFWEKKQHVWWVMIGKCSVSLSPKRKLDRLHCVRKDVLEYCLLFHNSFCPPPSPLIETLIWFIAHFVLRLLIRLCDDDGGGGNWKEGKDLWSNEANQIWLVHLWTQKKARTGQTRIVVFSLFVVDFSPFFLWVMLMGSLLCNSPTTTNTTILLEHSILWIYGKLIPFGTKSNKTNKSILDSLNGKCLFFFDRK